MLFVASVLGYYCKAMTSHPECGSAPKAQCSSHKVVVRGRRATAEIFENSTVAYSSSCDYVYCPPSAYELNPPLARKVTYVWNVSDVTSGSAIVAIFQRIP